jgi:putative methionine-R-sulfoxide reductase with GAF domain
MANVKTSLQAAVDKTIAESANTRAVSIVPSMKDGHPIASIDVLTYTMTKFGRMKAQPPAQAPQKPPRR